MNVSAYTVVQVRDVSDVVEVRDMSAYTGVQVRDVSAYTVVQVRHVSLHCGASETRQLTLWCK